MRARGRRGSVAVEFAFSLPVLFVIVAGVIEWGWYLFREVAVVQAVRDGALAAAVHEEPDDAETVGMNQTLSALELAGLDADASEVAADLASTADGDMITVIATVPYEELIQLLPAPATMRAETTFRMVVQ